ncbi:wax ester synthase/diacylglycerol acyltransferase [Rhodococcus pyridinivorans SB3094]|uniref:Diacylglycerol O-acyltransferase n=1 Tax=Rhodococcus pyridinivorans SB3094 TaxID=1435356 RepID=V9XDM3_9NOCA|nr:MULTISPECIES: wax ester/triacylglycerol synthase family O-acyltransferase [Rhodococcus]AHD20095.1 wax ester synthase/diacylglycerol acyltransferase [Rhodococcus pyridinivorans SB3094]MCT7292181.1 wax ester/triacylglycerol synthase family O-acyltransferase [Rhodococcus sp. PAE-6]
MRPPMSPTDSMFILGESRDHPMHVGGLILLSPQDGTSAADLGALFTAATQNGEVAPLWRKRAVRSLGTFGQWAWEEDAELDLSYHVRRNALPQPGGLDELWDLVSRLHSTLLDRSRPLWQMHVIEGLADGRLAVYTKIHHALADGVGAMKLLRRALSPDSEQTDMPAPWSLFDAPSRSHSSGTALDLPEAAMQAVRTATSEVTGFVPALAGTVNRALRGGGGSLSLAAPNTMINVPISGTRRFAARSWPLTRLRAVSRAADATVNDVVLAMSSGALRAFLSEQEALPDKSLVAMVPMCLRPDKDCAGNELGVLMADMGTDLADPADRLARVSASTTQGKTSMQGMSSLSRLAASALGVAPLAVGILTRNRALPRPPFNVIVSNVPGAPDPLYWNGARVDAVYPLSVPVDGQALNITCTSTDDAIAFGLTSCSRSLPQLQPLLDHFDTALGELEDAFDIVPVADETSLRAG